MLSAGTASLLPNSDGFGTAARQQFLHATQWEVLSENELSLNSSVDGHFPAILKRLILFHPSAECSALAKDTFQSRARQLIEERRVSAL
jgi:hypothetical protein